MPANDQQFDPRFDPAFQRGFDGAPQPQRRSAAPVVQQVPAPTPVRESPPMPPVGERPPATRQPASAAAPNARDDRPSMGDGRGDRETDSRYDRADEAADDAAETRPPWTNPFLIALAVVAVALVAAGAWMFQAAREPLLGTGVNSQADYATLTVLMELAPMVVALGAGTAIGIVFVLAVDWQKRRR